MDKIIFYTIGCPMCSLLKQRLDDKHIVYIEETNQNLMRNKGIHHVPVLEVEGQLLNCANALKWVEKQ